MTTMDPLRCVGIRQAVLSGDGSTVLLEMSMANGKIFPLELNAPGVELMSRALMACAQALGGARPTERALAETQAAEAVVVPVDELALHRPDDASAQLLARVGCIDLALALPNAAAADALAQALRAPRSLSA